MAVLQPFKAWRPTPQKASQIACVPYDVINSSEAKHLSSDGKQRFLHVIRPEIDLPEDTSLYDDAVYDKGIENLHELLASGDFIQEEEVALYIYKLTMGDHSQAGVFGCVSVEDYNNNVILKHELTRPAKEDDRTRHILTQQAHAEPVMLTFRDQGSVTTFMNEVMEAEEPLYRLQTDDHIHHEIWKVPDSYGLQQIFDEIPKFYVADGHHRCASAARAAKTMKEKTDSHTEAEAYNYFPAVLFPMQQMEILAYNRIVKCIPHNFLNQLKEQFEISETNTKVPTEKGTLSIYLNQKWYTLKLPDSPSENPADQLDVARLQEFILNPLLDIEDVRTDSNVDFVGGIRGTDELEKLVDNGDAALAFSMYPTSMEELLEVSDAGELMPPKSTWFEPKLRSGLLVHTF